MKHVTPLGLAVLAGAMLWALVGAGTAMGATNFCTAQESPCKEANRWAAGTVVDFTLKPGTNVKLAGTSGETLEECTGSTVKSKLENPEPITGPVESLTWTGCNFPTTTTTLGKLQVENAATSHNGTVKADAEIKFTINGGFFGSCVYALTSGTDLGELKEGKPAILAVNAVAEKLSGSATACPETAKWTAEYTLNEPSEKTLSVESGVVLRGSVLCTVQESPCKEANALVSGTTLDLTVKSSTLAKLVSTGGETLDECTGSTVKGKTEKTEFVKGSIESLTWTGCSFTTTTSKLGDLEIENATTAHNGTVKGTSEISVTINALFFGGCTYGIKSGTDLGELKEGKPATFVANAVAEKKEGSAVACPETAKWTAEYTLTEPGEKTVSVEKGNAGEAPVFCVAEETPCKEANRWATGTTLDFSLKSGNTLRFTETSGESFDTCTSSTLKAKTENIVGIMAPIESLTFGSCVTSSSISVPKLGKIEVVRAGVGATHNGTVKFVATTEITMNSILYGHCVYGPTAGTELGELKEGKPATLIVNTVLKKLTGSEFVCPETAKMIAEFTLTEPKEKTLSVETT